MYLCVSMFRGSTLNRAVLFFPIFVQMPFMETGIDYLSLKRHYAKPNDTLNKP